MDPYLVRIFLHISIAEAEIIDEGVSGVVVMKVFDIGLIPYHFEHPRFRDRLSGFCERPDVPVGEHQNDIIPLLKMRSRPRDELFAAFDT